MSHTYTSDKLHTNTHHRIHRIMKTVCCTTGLRNCLREGLVSECVFATVCHIEKAVLIFVLCVDGSHGGTVETKYENTM